MDPKIYNFLKYTAIILALTWVAWGIYDSFISGRNPGDAEYHAANKLFEDGHYQRALESYEASLDLVPNNIHSLRGRARALLQLGNYQDALLAFNDAIAMDPDFAGTYANRGILFDRMGRYEKAIADYRTALLLDPEIAEGPHWLTRFLRNQPDKPPGILERAKYLSEELKKPKSERVLSVPEIDEQQRTYQQ